MAQVLTASLPTFRSAEPVISFTDARQMAAKYGTPLLILSRSVLIRNCQALQACLPNIEFYYAAKANPDPTILRTLRKLGCSVDVCSHREARLALRAGFHPSAMIHTHPCKTVRNLVDCYAEGIRWFTFDSPSELPKLARHAPDANLLLRLAVASTSSVIDLSAKFGAAPDDALSLLLRARRMGLRVGGISFHVGSQCISPADFHSALSEARSVWDQASDAGLALEVLDIGGGIPAPYRQSILSTEAYCEALMQALESNFGDLLLGGGIRVIAEPGRCLCAEAITLIVSVIGKTHRNGRTWYFIDDGLYGSFSGKVYDHADFPLLAEDSGGRAVHPCVVAGPTCDSTDVVARDQFLPDLDVGDLLLVPSMGAYTSVSASGFNGMDVARIVAID
jgi:ornithine decarboxylase